MRLFLAARGLQCCSSFSPAVGSRGSSVAVVCGLCVAATSLVAEHGFWGPWASVAAAPRLRSTGLGVVRHGLCRSMTCGVLVDQGLNPTLAGGFPINEPPPKPAGHYYELY